MTDADTAYANAERAIAEAKADGATELRLDSQSGFKALTTLPPEIADLTTPPRLDLNGTQIADLTPLAGMTDLQRLYLNHTQIIDLTPLAGMTDLQTLTLNHTQIIDLTPLAGMTDLQTLTLTGTQITDLTPLAGMTDLQGLDLNTTQITDLTPLAGMTALRTLTLSNTRITDLTPLAAMTALEWLNLYRTQITDLTPLAAMTTLQNLDLQNTQIADLRQIRHLAALIHGDDRSRIGGIRFKNTPATRLDPHLKTLSEIANNTDRTRQTLAYLNTLGDDWPPVPATNPEQDALLPVIVSGDKYDIAPSYPSAAEQTDVVKRKAHDRLRTHADGLALAAGNQFHHLAANARSLVSKLDRDFGDLEILDIHFDLEELRGTFERRSERTGEDAYTPDVVDALDKVLMIGPGLTLDNADVQRLEDRRDRYRGTVPDPATLAAQDALSVSITINPELFGGRLRAVEEQVARSSSTDFNRLRVAQQAANRNILIAVGTIVANGMLGGPLSAMGNQSVAWLVSQSDTLSVLMPGWGDALTAWLTPILMRAREADQAIRHIARR